MRNIALIGCGYWGTKLRKYILESNYFKLCYIANSKFKKKWIWDDSKVDAVIIATPINTHYDIAKEALLNNKHVFAEKPVTMHVDEAIELKEMAQARNLKICVDYVQTFSPSINLIKKEINDIGTLKSIEMSTKHLGRFMDNNVYWLLASHHLSILDMFVDLDSLEFQFTDLLTNKDICTTGLITFQNKKMRGILSVSLNYPGKEMSINFYGTRGTIQWNALSKDTIRKTVYKKIYGGLPDELIKSDNKYSYDENNNLIHAIKYFANVLEGKATDNIDRAIKITRILENGKASSIKKCRLSEDGLSILHCSDNCEELNKGRINTISGSFGNNKEPCKLLKQVIPKFLNVLYANLSNLGTK